MVGCSQIATVKQTTPSFAIVGTQEERLAPAERQLSDARKLEQADPSRALGNYLASAHAAFDQLQRDPHDKQARDLYNFSVARSIEVIGEARLNPWDRALTVPTPDGEYSLTSVRHPEPDRNPAAYELIPSDTVILGGTFISRHVTIEGIGAPVVAVGRERWLTVSCSAILKVGGLLTDQRDHIRRASVAKGVARPSALWRQCRSVVRCLLPAKLVAYSATSTFFPRNYLR